MGPSQAQEPTEPTLIVNEGERFQLRDDIWIEKRDEATAKDIQQACEPAHYKINKDIWDRHLYAFVMQQRLRRHYLGQAFQAVNTELSNSKRDMQRVWEIASRYLLVWPSDLRDWSQPGGMRPQSAAKQSATAVTLDASGAAGR